MIIVVTGGRDYTRVRRVWEVLGSLGDITEVRQGGARGADYLAWRWALENDIPCRVYHADWAREGRSAGPRRNLRMLRTRPLPNLVVAFPGGRGTADCVRSARQLGIDVLEVEG